MTNWGRLKFVIGILIVLAVVAILLVQLSLNLLKVGSVKAEIGYDSYTVGTPYPGVIVMQNVQQGDAVKVGDILFEVQSSTLTDDIAKSRASATSFDLNENGSLLIKATGNGIVSDIEFSEGSYVSGTRDIAKILIDGTAFVRGDFLLSPPDYSRIDVGNRVDVLLPNNQTVSATVEDIAVKNDNTKAVTSIRSKLDQKLESNSFADGTPVRATVYLNGKTLVDGFKELVTKLFTPSSQ